MRTLARRHCSTIQIFYWTSEEIPSDFTASTGCLRSKSGGFVIYNTGQSGTDRRIYVVIRREKRSPAGNADHTRCNNPIPRSRYIMSMNFAHEVYSSYNLCASNRSA
ncbi:hypothetical protein I7I50_07657 [Histoplasma capsulatum G186AR]|uniref:Uncharacterized protein n=1 Tax=Ajellomyces capsulatus TaxID=5037 RepID=A0A8H7YZP7_AJECA|nr:hypothetical protein I7I52_09270 [Histoplasma capsulatum]QSS68297.1 hypothetical protein I7I50_07657 [Histoplasma capsulatum G186AR]